MPEVKDTVHKHSLLYHLTFSVLESLPTASDLYSEVDTDQKTKVQQINRDFRLGQ